MPKKLTQEEFINRAKEKHGDKYDYSKVNYINSSTKICIICPIHGEFWQAPLDHLKYKGCKLCSYDGIKSEYFGFGVYDTHDAFLDSYNRKSFTTWRSMIERCYNEKLRRKWANYLDVTVCDEWKIFSGFKKWFDEHYVEGWCLDKDILIKGNKIYSPSTCCFVPQEINNLTVRQPKKKRNNIIGVFKVKNKEQYIAHLSEYGKNVHLGVFDNEIDAFNAYKKEKERYIKEVANKWKDKIEQHVYDALCDYQVEITD